MFDLINLEKDVLKFWEKNKIYSTLKKKRKKNKGFYFLDGPPYTSGEVHIGTAWNKVLKDCILRYKRMQGFDVWDRAGYDMHGLPTAHAVEKKLDLKHKEDIPKFGVSKFIEECKKFSLKNLKKMNEDFMRLGVWMDFKNAYQTINPEFIEGEWWLVKQAEKKKRLYEGEKVMHWCPNCATALAKHELEYRNKQDDSGFFKFRVKNNENEFLVIWTTTFWTLDFNVAVMVNPDLDYVRAKVGNEVWIVAKDLVSDLEEITNKRFKIIEEFKGKNLDGLKYEHPFYNELREHFDRLRKESNRVHTILLSKEYVDTSSGSGLVHCAVGCGVEDYEVGHKYGILPFNEVDEFGYYRSNMGKFSGWHVFVDIDKFVEAYKDKGSLIYVTPIEHEYPHCWRCHEPVIFRTTKQWFFKVEDLIPKMRKLNKKIRWQPSWAGERWFDSWLENLRDNGITRQRYWGAPLPIWKCDKCEDYIVIGSRDELKKLSGKFPRDLHRPYIDRITIKCKCGGVKKRIPDILDVWIDAGTTSWTCLDFPQKKDLFKKLWPADFILEGKDQIRGWFNLLLVSSMLAFGKHPYKSCYMHGFIQDAKGRKMSKSLKNYISPYEVINKYGADTFRYYSIGGANPGLDLNYNFEDMKVKFRNLNILYNLSNLLLNYCDKKQSKVDLDLEEKYIFSKLHSCIEKATKAFEDYRINEVPWIIEEVFLELSRTYVQLTRDKINNNPKPVLYTIYNVLFEILKLFAPICPFITEEIYQKLKKRFKLKEESIHFYKWPRFDRKLVNKKLEESFDLMKDIIQEALAQREEAKLGIRWPLPKLTIFVKETGLNKLKKLIKQAINVKKVEIKKGKFKVRLDTNLTEKLEGEGYARELMRKIQSLRKKANLQRKDKIKLSIYSEYDLSMFSNEIKNKVGAEKISFKKGNYKIKSIEKIKEKNFEISFQKV